MTRTKGATHQSLRWLTLELSATLIPLSACATTHAGGQHAAAADEAASRFASRLLTYQDNGAHMDAAFNDKLSLNEAGCFALSDGSTISLRNTWSVSPDGGGVISGDGVEVRLGDRFEAGGGYGGPPREDLSDAQQRCPSDGPPFSNGGKYSSFATLWGVTVN